MNRQLVILRGLTMLYFATNAVLTPFLPIYFEDRGYSSSQIGLLMMFGPFIAIFAQPFWGYVSDRYQNPKTIVFTLWTLSLLASAGLFLTDGFSYAFLFMLLLYFFLLPSNPLLDSISIKTTLQAGVPYGSVRLYGSIGFTVVAIGSGYVLSRLGGVQSIPYLYWGVWLLPLALVLFLKDDKGGGPRVTFKSFGSVAKNKPFLWFLFLVFLLMIPHRMNDGLAALYLKDLGASDALLGWAWALASLGEIPTFALFGRYMHRFHEMALLGVVGLIYTARWLLYYAVDDPFYVMLLQASHMVTFAVFWLVAVQCAVRMVPEELRSTGLSLLSAVFIGLAGIVGGTLGGYVKDLWGGEHMYLMGAVLAFVASLLLFGTHAYERNKKTVRA